MYVHDLSGFCKCKQIEYSLYCHEGKLIFEFGDKTIPFAKNDWQIITKIVRPQIYYKKDYLKYQLKEHKENECNPQPQ